MHLVDEFRPRLVTLLKPRPSLARQVSRTLREAPRQQEPFQCRLRQRWEWHGRPLVLGGQSPAISDSA